MSRYAHRHIFYYQPEGGMWVKYQKTLLLGTVWNIQISIEKSSMEVHVFLVDLSSHQFLRKCISARNEKKRPYPHIKVNLQLPPYVGKVAGNRKCISARNEKKRPYPHIS